MDRVSGTNVNRNIESYYFDFENISAKCNKTGSKRTKARFSNIIIEVFSNIINKVQFLAFYSKKSLFMIMKKRARHFKKIDEIYVFSFV